MGRRRLGAELGEAAGETMRRGRARWGGEAEERASKESGGGGRERRGERERW